MRMHPVPRTDVVVRRIKERGYGKVGPAIGMGIKLWDAKDSLKPWKAQKGAGRLLP